MIDKGAGKAQSPVEEETLRTHLRHILQILGPAIAVYCCITALGETLIGNWDWHIIGFFGMAAGALWLSTKIRDDTAVAAKQLLPKSGWDPRTIESAKRRSEGVE